MTEEIHITVKWKKQGGPDEFRRPDLIARYLREHLPRVLFRVDLEGARMREALAADYVADLEARREVDPVTRVAAATIAACHEKPPGWDDYTISLDYKVELA